MWVMYVQLKDMIRTVIKSKSEQSCKKRNFSFSLTCIEYNKTAEQKPLSFHVCCCYIFFFTGLLLT